MSKFYLNRPKLLAITGLNRNTHTYWCTDRGRPLLIYSVLKWMRRKTNVCSVCLHSFIILEKEILDINLNLKIAAFSTITCSFRLTCNLVKSTSTVGRTHLYYSPSCFLCFLHQHTYFHYYWLKNNAEKRIWIKHSKERFFAGW